MSGTPVDHAGAEHLRLSGPHAEMGDHPHGGSLVVELVSPEAVLYRGRALSLVVPAYDGLLGILPRHAPLLALLGDGELVLRASGGDRRYRVGGGFVQVRDNTVRVVAERASTIDGKAAPA